MRSKFGLFVAEDLSSTSASTAWATASTCCTSTSAARSTTSATSRTRSSSWSASTPRCQRLGGPAIHRRRRRPGRRLRRLQDRLRLVHQLRPRRNTPTTSSSTSRKSATRRRRAPDDHQRKRPGDGRVPQRAGVQRDRLVSGFAGFDLPTAAESRRGRAPLVNLFDTFVGLTTRNELHGVLPRRAAGAGRGAEPVQPRLLLAGAPQPRRAAVLRHLLEGPEHRRRARLRPGRVPGPGGRCSSTRTSATSRSSSRCPTPGRSTSSSRSCRSTG